MSFDQDHIDDATRKYATSTRRTCDPAQTDCDESIFDFDSMIDDKPEPDELFIFNKMYSTSYTLEQYQKFSQYKDHYGLRTEDAFEYIKSCHSCNTPLDTFAGEYCSGGCHNFIENLEMTCFRGIDCLICNRATRCHCDDSPVKYVTCQTCEYEEDELYSYRYKSTIYCNQCAIDVCGVVVNRPEQKFHVEDAAITCDNCGFDEDSRYVQYYNSNVYCNGCVFDMLPDVEETKYSLEEQRDLKWYAEKYELTMEEAIEYKTHCHTCGKYVENAKFNSPSHQYCNKVCYEYCEEYFYPCYREGDCRVCSVWAFRKLQEEMNQKSEFLAAYEPVLSTIDAWKELCVYGQLYECIPDLIEYFDYEL